MRRNRRHCLRRAIEVDVIPAQGARLLGTITEANLDALGEKSVSDSGPQLAMAVSQYQANSSDVAARYTPRGRPLAASGRAPRETSP